MQCPRCGAEVGEALQFCKQCRTEMLLKSGEQNVFSTAFIALFIVALVSVGALLYVFVGDGFLRSEQATSDSTAKDLAQNAASAISAKEDKTSGYIVRPRQERGSDDLSAEGLQAQGGGGRVEISNAQAALIRSENYLDILLFTQGVNQRERPEAVLRVSVQDTTEGVQCDSGASLGLLDFYDPQTSKLVTTTEVDILECEVKAIAGEPMELALHVREAAEALTSFVLSFDGTLAELERSVVIEQTSDELYQIAFWDSSRGTVDIGFFKKEPSLDDIRRYSTQQIRLASIAQNASLALQLELTEGNNRVERSFLKSFSVYPGAQESASIDKLLAPGFKRLVSTSTASEFTYLPGKLGAGQLLQLQLRDTRIRKSTSQQAVVLWDIVVSAPVIDVHKELDPRVLSRLATVGDTLPSSASGVVQTESSLFHVKDTVLLYYPKWRSLSLGLYSRSLKENERQQLEEANSLWAVPKELRPSVAMNIQLTDSYKVSHIESTFVRGFFGDFHFGGERDRQVVKRSSQQLQASNLLAFSLQDNPEPVVAMRFRDQQEIAAEVNFFWDVSVRAKAVVVE